MLPRRRPPSSGIPRTSFVHSGRPPPRKPLSAVTRVIVSVVLLALMAVSIDSVTSRHVEVSSSETIGAERTVFTLCTNVNVEITGPVPTQNTVEVNACDVCLVVAEEGRGVIVSAGDIDVRTEVHCRLPTEIIIRVLAVRNPDLRPPLEGRAPTEQQPVPIGSEVWCDVVARAVDVWPQVLGRPPRVVRAGALGNPNVAATKTP